METHLSLSLLHRSLVMAARCHHLSHTCCPEMEIHGRDKQETRSNPSELAIIFGAFASSSAMSAFVGAIRKSNILN